MRYITAEKCVAILLGRQGENNVTTVQFDVSGWAEEYGEGAFTLLNKRSGDTAAYPCFITVDEDNEIVNWVIEEADVYYKGYGKVQLAYVVDEAIAKSEIFATYTAASVDGGDIPEPTPSWIEQVLTYGAEMEDSQHNAQKWATGEIDGVPVPETDETYHNNSKWYAEQASEAEGYAADAANSAEEAENSAREAAAYVGSPLVALTAAAMADTTKVYVYAGSEAGYTNGDWYYYNGTAWVSGGVYNSVAIDVATDADIEAALYS